MLPYGRRFTSCGPRPGTTLLELTVVLAILGLCAAIVLPRLGAQRDRVAVEAAAASVTGALTTARAAALRAARVTAMRFDTGNATIVVQADRDTLVHRQLGTVHGVRLVVSRDSIAFAPNGLGYGAANTQVIVVRGAAAETVTVSRLGRWRR